MSFQKCKIVYLKYVKSFTLRMQTFKQMTSQVRVPNKNIVLDFFFCKLVLDIFTRWNSTYLILKTTLKFMDAFTRMVEIDSSYKCNPTVDKWEDARIVCECLRFFYEVTKHFSCSLYPAANYFFNLVCAVHLKLKDLCESNVPFIFVMDEQMI